MPVREGAIHWDAFTGGCQCGDIRYSVAAGPADFTICHCRMCQRAVGNLFAALVEVPVKSVAWSGRPARYASSNKAERGFCAACGTPLFFAFKGSDVIELTAGSVDGGPAHPPRTSHGIEARADWLASLTSGGIVTYLDDATPVRSQQTPKGY